TYNKSVIIDGIHFIASDFGERILITSHVLDSFERIKIDLNVHRFHEEELTFDYDLMDPYNLTNPVKQLFIEKLVEQSVKDNWLNYLRNDLNDYNKISTPPGKKDIIDFIRNIDSKKYIQGNETYEGYLTKWTLSCKDVMFTLEAFHEKSKVSEENKREPVHIKNQQKANMYGISVHYIWGVGKDVGKEINRDVKYWREIFDDSLPERLLPQSDLDGIINEANIKSNNDTTNLYDLLLDNYVEDNFFLARFGKILMEKFLDLNRDWWIEKLCENCINKCSYGNDKNSSDIQSNIQSLSIIAQFYSELIEKNPAIIYKFLSEMAFVVPSVENNNTYYNSLSSSPHLRHYSSHYDLYETSHINNAFFIISKYWLVFKNKSKPFIWNQPKSLENYYKSLSSVIQGFLIKPFENYYRTYYVDNNATIKLLFPLPYFVNYPKDFNTLKDLWKPEPIHVHELRDLIKDIQNGKWTTLEKPYISPLFLEYIYQEDESEISQIKKRLEDLTNDESEIRQIKKRVDDLTSNNYEIKKRLEDLTNDESEIRQIKKRVDDLTSDDSEISQIKNGLESLTKLFGSFKEEIISKLNELKQN
ncbi:7338_t:CDS:2, partial [Dentiscutata heterogama]